MNRENINGEEGKTYTEDERTALVQKASKTMPGVVGAFIAEAKENMELFDFDVFTGLDTRDVRMAVTVAQGKSWMCNALHYAQEMGMILLRVEEAAMKKGHDELALLCPAWTQYITEENVEKLLAVTITEVLDGGLLALMFIYNVVSLFK